MKIVFLGLSITSSWGNGHATNHRALVRELSARDHDVLFLERDKPWYAGHRDLPELPWGRTELYGSLEELEQHAEEVAAADLVVIGYAPEGVAVAEWALGHADGTVAFYDIDTPVTVEKLRRGDSEYLSPDLVGRFDLYLSFTGGPILRVLEEEFGARRALAFYCLVDPEFYRPLGAETPYWDLAYLGNYSEDRQPVLERMLLGPARKMGGYDFAVAGPQYPAEIVWPGNVERIEHVAPADHPGFYASQRFSLNVTRAPMRAAGWSPSVRLFEAAACAVPVISNRWDGLDQIFTPDEEILIADSPDDVVHYLMEIGEDDRLAIGERARARVLAEHTAERRCEQLEAEAAGAMTLPGRSHGLRPRVG